MYKNDDVVLYHGSKGGIIGDIYPSSRAKCDFGKGFYLGEMEEQAKSLIINDNNPVFYKIRLELSKIDSSKILRLKTDLYWAFYVLYNRGRLNDVKNSRLYNDISKLGKGKELIIGPIADDNMNNTIKKFTNNEITDKCLLAAISGVKYGIQYTLKTADMCKNLKIISEEEISETSETIEIQKFILQRSIERANIINTMERTQRYQGKFFDNLKYYYEKFGKFYANESPSVKKSLFSGR